MMFDKNSILSELEANGVIVENDGTISYFYEGKKDSTNIDNAISIFNMRSKNHKELIIELWNELSKHLSNFSKSLYEGTEITQRLFSNSIKQMRRLYKKYNLSNIGLNKVLLMDSKLFSESYMRATLEFTLSIDWLYYLMRTEVYKAYLLEQLNNKKEVLASGQMGHVDLKMEERVHVIGDEEDEDDELEQSGRLHPLYTKKFRQYDIQNGLTVYDLEDRVYRLMNPMHSINRRDERQPNRTLSRTI